MRGWRRETVDQQCDMRFQAQGLPDCSWLSLWLGRWAEAAVVAWAVPSLRGLPENPNLEICHCSRALSQTHLDVPKG